ncbi:MAG: Type secretion rane fusion protein HlyD family [Rhizobacter sp.]|nr:Type secretion rane fusion protein HlyD family [Rhizobacter sp.]
MSGWGADMSDLSLIALLSSGSLMAPPQRRSRASMLLSVAGLMLTAFVVWASWLRVDVTSHSLGEVVMSKQLRAVRAIDGGIVRRVLVKEGQGVKAGDALIELERTASDAERNELDARMAVLQIRILRLEALAAGSAVFSVPQVLSQKMPAEVQAARELFDTQRLRWAASVEADGSKPSSRESAGLTELLARRAQWVDKLALLRERVAVSENQLDDGQANQREHLKLLKEEQAAVRALDEVKVSLARLSPGRAPDTSSSRAAAASGREAIQKELQEARGQQKQFDERLLTYGDSQRRTVLRSPMDATVTGLGEVTAGTTVPAGATLLSLAPNGDDWLVEARLPVSDRGLVYPGQPASLTLTSAAAQDFPPIDATVLELSPELVLEHGRDPYIRVRLLPSQGQFSLGAHSHPIAPGVTVAVDIQTGERSVFSAGWHFLADPLMQAAHAILSKF